MTIKLSTTNSVNKTLQHKALWGLGGTPYRDVAAVKRACRLLGLRSSGLQTWYYCSSERDPQDSVSVREECNLGSGERCYLSTSVNKLSVSKSQKTKT